MNSHSSAEMPTPPEPKRSLLAYFVSLPFLLAFVGTLVSYDIFQRIFGRFSKRFHDCITHWLNSSIVLCLHLTGLRVKVTGKVPSEPGPYLLVSNHQSLMDIPFVTALFGKHCPRYISKKELTKYLPFVSYNLRTLGHAIIDRGNNTQAINEIKRVALEVKENKSAIAIFPEGTRAREGKLKVYKPGGFLAILDAIPDVKIIPITIEGSWKIAYYKLFPVPLGIEVFISIGDVVTCDSKEDAKELLTEIRNKSFEQIMQRRVSKNEQEKTET